MATLALVLVLALAPAACSGGDPPDLGSDGSVPASSDGSSDTTATAADTTGSSTTTTAEAGEVEVSSQLPDGWPDDLPIPRAAVLQLGQRSEQEEGSVLLTADFTVEDGGANVYTTFLRALQEGGATILQRSSGGTDDGFVGSISFTRSRYSGNVVVDEQAGTTSLSVSVVIDE